jgi:hypothetical protein
LDPFTLLALANGAVTAVKKGCQLYKDIKSAAGDVSAVLKDIDAQFAGKKVSKEQAKKIEEKKKEVKEAGNTDPGDALAQIGQRLGDFFDAMDKIEQAFHEQERMAHKIHDDKDGSLKRMALNRVMIKTRLEHMEAEIRQEMTWNTPQELGDLWTRFSKMWAQTLEEQTEARRIQLIKDQEERWRRQRIRNAIKDNLLWLVVFVILAIEALGLLWTIQLHQQNGLPSWLGL